MAAAAGRIAAGGEAVGDGVECGLILRERGGAGQREHAGCAVVAAGDAVLVGEVERVAADEACTDRHGGAGELAAAVGIADRQRAIERDRRTAAGEGRGAAWRSRSAAACTVVECAGGGVLLQALPSLTSS